MTPSPNSEILDTLFRPKLGDFQFKMLVTDNICSAEYLMDYQLNGNNLTRKGFTWAIEPLFTPANNHRFLAPINLILAWPQQNPGLLLPKIYQDILLNYFGNHTRRAFEEIGWDISKRPATIQPESIEDRWKLLKTVTNKAQYDALTKPRDYERGMDLHLSRWLAYFARNFEVGGVYNRRIWKLMQQKEIRLPLTDLKDLKDPIYADILSAYRLVMNFDEKTGEILDPLHPAPAKPVEVVTEEAKKKDEPENQSQNPSESAVPLNSPPSNEPTLPAPAVVASTEIQDPTTFNTIPE